MTKPKTLAECKELKGRVTLHNILCIEANIMDCEEAERIEGLIRQFYEERLEGLKKDRYLTSNNLEYQLGWVDGHKEGIEDAKGCL